MSDTVDVAESQARIRLGMVGGGQGAFIGEVHRIAARLDNKFELVAGALSSEPQRAAASAAELGIPAQRSYASYEEMAVAEKARADGIEAVAIVTPNHMHYPVAKAMLEAGIHVICDKPLTSTLEDAESLARLVEQAGKVFAVTYNYSGYPLVRQAREMVARGDLGELRVIQVEYPQDWLSENIESDASQKQALWRTDPAKSGAGGCIGDIGTHAFHLAGFVSGLQPSALLADLSSFVEGRAVDDNAHILLRYANGVRGMLWSSQVACGHENSLRLRLYGSKAGLEWAQEDPNRLHYRPLGAPAQILTRGGPAATPSANRVSRIPAGHPEGFLEAFANLYSDAAAAIISHRDGSALDPDAGLLPGIADGVKGVRFVSNAIASDRAGNRWVDCQ